MSTASRPLCLVLILAGLGLVPQTNPGTRASLPNPPALNLEQVRRLDHTAYTLARNGQYLEALELYRTVAADFLALRESQKAGRCLMAVGSCQFALFQYRKALDSYLEASKLAVAAGDWANVASLNSNISGLFLQMGDLDSAAQYAEQALTQFNRADFPGARSRCLIQLAVIRARQNRLEESAALIGEAIDNSYREGDLGAAAEGWDHLGGEWLSRGQLGNAQAALAEGFRLRKLHHLPHLDSSYYNLGRLHLAEGDLPSAAHLLDEAILWQSRPGNWTTPWLLYHARGQVRKAQGRIEAAFADFARALDLARQWRLEVLPADFTRISSEGELEQIYSSFIETANELYFAGRHPALAREAFRAAEENRSASLHALLRDPTDWRERLPVAYWEVLAASHAAEVEGLEANDAAGREKIRQLRARLAILEAQAGSNAALASGQLLERTQANLPAGAALFSFHLGDGHSYLWAISSSRFQVYQLPPKAELERDIARFSDAVQVGDAAAASLGRELYLKLFGQIGKAFQDSPHWILALDGQLFRLPFAALVVEPGGARPVYLVERHSIRVTTGAVLLAEGGRRHWNALLAGKFVGVGDAIYNTADPRWKQLPRQEPSFFPWLAYAAAPAAQTHGPVLTRLAGTGREVESCARAWNPQPGAAVLLEGSDASPARFRAALRAAPAVMHVAAHFLAANAPPHYSLIALSLAGSGDPQLLSPLEITRLKIDAGLVVLNGCSSGSADVLPASGLMGLTRAWLAGGAHAVVASHWPTPDDSGAFFVKFYELFRETPEAGPAVALQGAQRKMLRAGGWRSNPQYWATYFAVGDQ